VCTVRLLLDAHDEATQANLVAGRAVAITAADVRTLRSVQLKGVSLGVTPGGRPELERMRRFAEAFYADIEDTDGTPREILERLTPDALVVVCVAVTEVFDQTPGPAAGRCLPGADDDGRRAAVDEP
jgi:hypothetical protein